MCVEYLIIGLCGFSGFAFLFLSWKLSGKYKKTKKEPDTKPDAKHDDNSVPNK